MKKYCLGLEVSGKNCHLAMISRKKNHWRLLERLSIPATTADIRQALRQIGCRPSAIQQTVIGLPYSQVLIKEAHLDTRLTDAEVYQYLHQQLPTLLGKPAEHWFFDFEPLRFSVPPAQRTAFRLIATLKENITGWLQLCREASLRVHCVDVDVLALARLLPTLTAYQPEQPQALLWLKTNELLFVVGQAGQLIYAKRSTYVEHQPIMQTLAALLQFFNGLHPQHTPANVILMDENSHDRSENLPLPAAELSNSVWQSSAPVEAQYFCSLGLAIYEH